MALAALVGGCGVDVDVPDVGFDAPHDRATFIVDGQRTTIAQSGSATVSIGGAPQLDHDGPIGCRGRYFTSDDPELYFHWTGEHAYLLRYSTLYRFGAPHRSGGRLVWNRDFGGHEITVIANCPR